MWYMHEDSGWLMFLNWVWFAVFWIGIISLGIWALRKFTGQGGSEQRRPALEIARRRYAGGEISKQEFEQIKRDLY